SVYPLSLHDALPIPPEIQQVILNLLRNARQALASDLENNTEPSFKPMITLRAYADAEYATIEVEDNGHGMSEDVKSHIFEPFYRSEEHTSELQSREK